MSDEKHEIIIIRRRHDGDHDEAHGGVWKVAFADFMTAMMAFFLVLWIVNSTSKETRASVARYFNPVRLSDTTPARKGLQEPREEDFDAKAVEAGKKVADPAPSEKPGHDAPAASQGMHGDDAHANLAAVAASKGDRARAEDFRDPFAQAPAMALGDAAKDTAADAAPKPSAEAAAVARAVAALAQANTGAGPSIDLRETAEGTLISLTDRADYGMFAIGSAEPNAALVRLVTELGHVLRPSRTDDHRARSHGCAPISRIWFRQLAPVHGPRAKRRRHASARRRGRAADRTYRRLCRSQTTQCPRAWRRRKPPRGNPAS